MDAASQAARCDYEACRLQSKSTHARKAFTVAGPPGQSADAGDNDAGVRRCLLDEFTLSAEAEQWQLLSLEQEQAQAQAASSPMRMDGTGSMHSPPRPGAPEDCMTSPQALMMSASPNDAWQPGRLREVMQVPHMNLYCRRTKFP